MNTGLQHEPGRPTHAERRFALCCQQVYARTVSGGLDGDALGCIAALFDAGSASLRTLAQPPQGLCEDSPPLVFDASVADSPLAQLLEGAGARHGMGVMVGSDEVLLVLRDSSPFTPGERCWMELLAGHVRTAMQLARQLAPAPPAPASQPTIVPACAPLTKAELEVLASLLRGQTAKTIARNRGASLNTVRSQITAILGKTGRHTQKELIAAFSNM